MGFTDVSTWCVLLSNLGLCLGFSWVGALQSFWCFLSGFGSVDLLEAELLLQLGFLQVWLLGSRLLCSRSVYLILILCFAFRY